jgi:hypothetical protein
MHKCPGPIEDGRLTVVCWPGSEQVHSVVQDQRSRRLEDGDGEAAGPAERKGVAESKLLQFGNQTFGRSAFCEVARSDQML